MKKFMLMLVTLALLCNLCTGCGTNYYDAYATESPTQFTTETPTEYSPQYATEASTEYSPQFASDPINYNIDVDNFYDYVYKDDNHHSYSNNYNDNRQNNFYNKDEYNNIDNSTNTIVDVDTSVENEQTNNYNYNLTTISNDDVVTFTGVLTNEYYEINSTNTGYTDILKLDEPIKCYLKDDFNYDGSTLYEIDSVQVSIDEGDVTYGENITVTGTVMLAHTAHHLKDIVLMEVTID